MAQRRTFSAPAPRCENKRPLCHGRRIPGPERIIFCLGLSPFPVFPLPVSHRSFILLPFRYRRKESPRYPLTDGGRRLGLRSFHSLRGSGNFLTRNFLSSPCNGGTLSGDGFTGEGKAGRNREGEKTRGEKTNLTNINVDRSRRAP